MYRKNLSLFRKKVHFFYLDDFKPASVVKSDQAELTVGSLQDVSITLPNVEVKSINKSLIIFCFVVERVHQLNRLNFLVVQNHIHPKNV